MANKGYWINHVEEIKQPEVFQKYVAKWNKLVERGDCKVIVMGPVAKTQIGAKPMLFATVTEFEIFEMAMSYKNHPDYVDALKELGEDESDVVIRTSYVVEGP